MVPDSSFEATYFDDKVKHNLDCYYESVTGPEASPLGTYTVCSDGGFPRFLRDATEEYRNSWITHAPWQQNFLAWAFENAVEAGYPQAHSMPRRGRTSSLNAAALLCSPPGVVRCAVARGATRSDATAMVCLGDTAGPVLRNLQDAAVL